MPDLIAQGPRPQDRWRRPIAEETEAEPALLGRTVQGFGVPWDDRISRQHATLSWDGKQLLIRKLDAARNYIFHRGNRRDEFTISIGDHFVIGQTTFSLVDQRVRVLRDDAPAVTEHTFAASHLRQARYRDADRRIDVLSRLPEVIQGSGSEPEMMSRLVNLVMQGIDRASFIAIVSESSSDTPATPESTDRNRKRDPQSDSELSADNANETDENTVSVDDNIQILHWDSRNMTGPPFAPSAKLIRQALDTKESVLHLWSRSASPSGNENYTQSENVDWAFCSPILGDTKPSWAIYVAGDFSAFLSNSTNATSAIATDLQDDLKFAEVAATTLGTIRQSRLLQRRQDGLRPFFAPVVLQAFANREPDEVLKPRECEVAVLFCDLRGFSKQSEENADQLLELLRRVSDALGVMTHHILQSGGVVGDFHGDAAMGFWGWPFDEKDKVLAACKAALAIQEEFETASAISSHPLAGFRAGLGIATGRAVAGQIGTKDQVKVTVFGPVVNLASRLESMTKQLRAPILIDENTANAIQSSENNQVARLRRVARVLPYGMKTPLMVSELLAPEGPNSLLTNQHIDSYEQAVDALQTGRWSEAFRLLHQVPAEDRVKDFLTVFIAQHGRTPPADWDGYIGLPEK